MNCKLPTGLPLHFCEVRTKCFAGRALRLMGLVKEAS